MTALEIRSELAAIIARINNTAILDALRTLALRSAEQDEMETEMVRMAELSEADIKAGRVYSREEVEQWLKEQGDE